MSKMVLGRHRSILLLVSLGLALGLYATGLFLCGADVLVKNKKLSAKMFGESSPPVEGSVAEQYQDIVMTMMWPYIQDAVNDYYQRNCGCSPAIALFDIDVLSILRPNGYRAFEFLLELRVNPYLGAHNTIGTDIVTVKVYPGKISVEKFEHIRSYPIPKWLQ